MPFFCAESAVVEEVALDLALDTDCLCGIVDVRRTPAELGFVAPAGVVALLAGHGLDVDPEEGPEDGFDRLRSEVNDGPRGVVRGRFGGIVDLVSVGLDLVGF